jgi:excisionase family DNA binding protein
MPEHSKPTVCSVLQLSKRWECSRAHIYHMIERGELPALRMGSAVRIRIVDIEAFEATPSVPEPPPPPVWVRPAALSPGASGSDAFRLGQAIRARFDAERLKREQQAVKPTSKK